MTPETTKNLLEHKTFIDSLADREGALEEFLKGKEDGSEPRSLASWIRSVLFHRFGQRHQAKNPKQREAALSQLRASVIPKGLESVEGSKRMNPGRALSEVEHEWLSGQMVDMLHAAGAWNEENLKETASPDAVDNGPSMAELEARAEELKKELAEASDPYAGDHSEHVQPLNLKSLKGNLIRDLEDTRMKASSGEPLRSGVKGGSDAEMEELAATLEHNYGVVSKQISKMAPGSVSEDEIDNYSFAAAQYVLRTPGTASFGRDVDTEVSTGDSLNKDLSLVLQAAAEVSKKMADGSLANEHLKDVQEWASAMAPHFEGRKVAPRGESFPALMSRVLRELSNKAKSGVFASGLAPLEEELDKEVYTPLSISKPTRPPVKRSDKEMVSHLPLAAANALGDIEMASAKMGKPWYHVASDKEYMLTVQDTMKASAVLSQAMSDSARRGAKDSEVLKQALKKLSAIHKAAMVGEFTSNRALLQDKLKAVKAEASLGDTFFEHFADSADRATSRMIQGLLREQLTNILKARGEHSDKHEQQARTYSLGAELSRTLKALEDLKASSKVTVPDYAVKHGIWGKKVALPKEFRDRANEALGRSAPETGGRKEDLNPFAGEAAEDYAGSLLDNLYRMSKPGEVVTHLDYQELETYMSKFWDGLFSFVDGFDENYRKYRAGLESALAKNPYVVPDVDDLVKVYSKDLEGRVANVVAAASHMKGGAGGAASSKAILDMTRRVVAGSLNDFSHESGRFTGDSRDSLTDSVKQALALLGNEFYSGHRGSLEEAIHSKDAAKADSAYGTLQSALVSGLQRQDGGHKHKAELVAGAAIAKYLEGKGLRYEPEAVLASQDPRTREADGSTIELAEDLKAEAIKKAEGDTLPSVTDLREAIEDLRSRADVQTTLEEMRSMLSSALAHGDKPLRWHDPAKSAADAVSAIYSTVADANKEIREKREAGADEKTLADLTASKEAGVRASVLSLLGPDVGGIVLSSADTPLELRLASMKSALPHLVSEISRKAGTAGVKVDNVAIYNPESNASVLSNYVDTQIQELIGHARLLAKVDGWQERYLMALSSLISTELDGGRGDAALRMLLSHIRGKIDKAMSSDPFARGYKESLSSVIGEDRKVRDLYNLVASALSSNNEAALEDAFHNKLHHVASEVAKQYRMSVVPVTATIASLLPSSPDSSNSVTLAVKAFKKGVAGMRTDVRTRLLPKGSVKGTLSDMAEDPDSDVKGLFKSQSKPYTGKLYPVEYHDEGSLNFLKGYLKRIVDQDYFSDMLAGRRRDMDTSKPQLLPTSKTAAFGGGPDRDLTGQNLAGVVMSDLDEAYRSITTNPVFMVVDGLVHKYGKKPSYPEFFSAVQEANSGGAGITKDSFKKLISSVDAMMGVERLYDTEARRIASKFEKAILGIYKYLDKDNVLREISRRQTKGEK